jgi:hypothetical protein
VSPAMIIADVAAIIIASLPAAITFTQMEDFASRWGVPMLLVVLVMLYGLGAARRREKRDEAREQRLMGGFDLLSGVTQRLERSVTRQTAVMLATTEVSEERIESLVARLTAQDQSCGICVLKGYPAHERDQVAERAAYCQQHYPSCAVAVELLEQQKQGRLI